MPRSMHAFCCDLHVYIYIYIYTCNYVYLKHLKCSYKCNERFSPWNQLTSYYSNSAKKVVAIMPEVWRSPKLGACSFKQEPAFEQQCLYCTMHLDLKILVQGRVVQKAISANPGLKSNRLFILVCSALVLKLKLSKAKHFMYCLINEQECFIRYKDTRR